MLLTQFGQADFKYSISVFQKGVDFELLSVKCAKKWVLRGQLECILKVSSYHFQLFFFREKIAIDLNFRIISLFLSEDG